MPMMNDTEEMDGLYGEGPSKSQPESVDQENKEQMEHTAVVPLSVLSPDGEPVKSGDEIVVKVGEVYGEEAEISYAPKKVGGGSTSMDDEKEIESMDTEDY